MKYGTWRLPQGQSPVTTSSVNDNKCMIFRCQVCLQNNFHHKIRSPFQFAAWSASEWSYRSFCIGTLWFSQQNIWLLWTCFNPTFGITRAIFVIQNQLQWSLEFQNHYSEVSTNGGTPQIPVSRPV